MKIRYAFPIASALLIAILASLLYIPFLGNGLVFDDHSLFTSLQIYDAARATWFFGPRTFPNFTLGLVQVLYGTIDANRIVSLVLHILCAWMLFALLSTLLCQALKTATSDTINAHVSKQARILALIGAVWFALNPVAVYGAAYLVQRSIVFATLFSLLSLWFFRRAFAENRTADVITAALFYSAAVLSKEHAIMLPLAALALATLYPGDFRSHAKRGGLYLLLCLPAAATAVLGRSQGVVATGYEPFVGQTLSQIQGIPLLDQPWGPWLVSGLLQAGAFFDYFYYWAIPDIRSISIDMRLDFAQIWSTGWLAPKVALFIAVPIMSLYCLRRGGRAALIGCGLLYSWLLFFTELSTVRFQEPFVLYRSYLWAPGFAMILVALLSSLHLQRVVITFTLAAPLLFILAFDRLESLKSDRTIWEDAAAKLELPNLPGADRIYYNRAGEYFKLKQYSAAMSDLDRVVNLNPNAFQGYLGRGRIYLRLEKPAEALSELDKSLQLAPPKNGFYGVVQYLRGTALASLGQSAEALKSYKLSADDGHYFAKLIVQQHNKQDIR